MNTENIREKDDWFLNGCQTSLTGEGMLHFERKCLRDFVVA